MLCKLILSHAINLLSVWSFLVELVFLNILQIIGLFVKYLQKLFGLSAFQKLIIADIFWVPKMILMFIQSKNDRH